MENEKIQKMRNVIDFAKENFLEEVKNLLSDKESIDDTKKMLVTAHNRICHLTGMKSAKVFTVDNNRDFAEGLSDISYRHDSDQLFESLLNARIQGYKYVWCVDNQDVLTEVDFVVLVESIENNFKYLFEDVIENPFYNDEIMGLFFPTEYIEE